MNKITWSGVLLFAAIAALSTYIVVTKPPQYRLVQPDGREAQRGRAAPRLDANECIRPAVQASRVVKPITAGKVGGVEVTVESGKLEGTVTRRGPSGNWPAELDVRRFLYAGGKGIPHGEHSGTVLNAVIVDTQGMGGSQRMFVTTHGGGGGSLPDEVADSFMRCMLKRGYAVQKVVRNWKDWKEWAMLLTELLPDR